jgi:hypothetical protein
MADAKAFCTPKPDEDKEEGEAAEGAGNPAEGEAAEEAGNPAEGEAAEEAGNAAEGDDKEEHDRGVAALLQATSVIAPLPEEGAHDCHITALVEVSGETVQSFDIAKQALFKQIFASFLEVSSSDLEVTVTSAIHRLRARRSLFTGDGIIIGVMMNVHGADDAALELTSARLVGVLQSAPAMALIERALVEQHVVAVGSFKLEASSVETININVGNISHEAVLAPVPAADDASIVAEPDAIAPVPAAEILAPVAPTAEAVVSAPIAVGGNAVLPAKNSSSTTVIAITSSVGGLCMIVALAFLFVRSRAKTGAKSNLNLKGSYHSQDQDQIKSTTHTPVPSGSSAAPVNSSVPLRQGSDGNENWEQSELSEDQDGDAEEAEAEERRAQARAGVQAEVEAMRRQRTAAAAKQAAAVKKEASCWDGAAHTPTLTETKLRDSSKGLDPTAFMLSSTGTPGGAQLFQPVEFDGQTVSVKRFDPHTQPSQAVRHRLELWTKSCKHPNLLPLLGTMAEPNKPICLVYPFMAEGSLSEHLTDPLRRAKLGWAQRLLVMQAIAKAVLFLHSPLKPTTGEGNTRSAATRGRASQEGKGCSKPSITHGAIRATNVLLDQHQTKSHARLTEILLTAGDDSTVAADKFAFGILLLEVLCGELGPSPTKTKVTSPSSADTEVDLDFDEIDVNGPSDGADDGADEPDLTMSTSSDDRGRLTPDRAESGAQDASGSPKGIIECDQEHPLLVRARVESAADFADSQMKEVWPAMVAYSVHSLAIRCTAAEPSERPEFSTVLKGLELLTATATEDTTGEKAPVSIVVRI